MTTAFRTSLFASLAMSLLFVGAGCFIKFNDSGSTTAGTGADGGIFKSVDRGEQWVQKNTILTTGEKKTLNNVAITTIAQDPQDAAALYVGTTENGMFYSLDGGESWQQPAQVNKSRVGSIAVNPKQKCTVYAAAENKLLKTTDCSRTWTVTYLDPRADKRIMSVALDSSRPEVVWIGTSTGDILRSSDNGSSWAKVKNVTGVITRVIVNPADNRRVIVATQKNGIFRTIDGGANWEDLSKRYSTFSGAKEFTDIATSPAAPAMIVFASKFGLLRSSDNGNTWDAVPILTSQPGAPLIFSVALDSQDASIMYYSTATTFYRSTNAGQNWVPKKLPTSRAATTMLVDQHRGAALYMGTAKVQ